MLKLLFQLWKAGALSDAMQLVFQNKVDEWKVRFFRKLAYVLASIIMIIIVSFVFLIMFLFLGLGIAILLNEILDSYYLGFLIVGGVFFLVAFFLSMSIRSGTLQKKLFETMMNVLEKDTTSDN